MGLIGRVVEDAALRAPAIPALKTYDGLDLTYAELDQRAARLANALLGLGLTPGDRVAAWLDTCPQYLELYFAVAKAGLVLLPVNSMLTEHEAEFLLTDSGAEVLFHLPAGATAAAGLAARTEARTLSGSGFGTTRAVPMKRSCRRARPRRSHPRPRTIFTSSPTRAARPDGPRVRRSLPGR